jgi:hypothetical protein
MGDALVLALVLSICVGVYVFFCHCLRVICQKVGEEPGCLIWVPVLQMIPLLKIAGLPVWAIIGFFVPIVNLVLTIIMWVNICKARGKSPLLAILIVVPLGPLFLIPYLAFSE